MTMKRILFNLMLLATTVYTPWWFSLMLVAVGVFKFPFYGEAILFGILIDLLYGTATSYGFGITGLVLTLGIFVVTLRFKNMVRSGYRGQ